MPKIKIASLLCLAVLVIFSVSSVSAATDSKVQSVNKSNEFKQNLKYLDTTNPIKKEIKKTGAKIFELPQLSGSSAQFDENKKAIVLKFKGKEFKIIDKDTKTSTYELDSGSIIRKNPSGDITSSIEAIDGGIRMVLNIEKTSERYYSYDFPLDTESGMKYTMNGQSVLLTDSSNTTIVSIMNPWATDSNKKSLRTWYTIENNGTTLRQHVDLLNAKFPILADPTWCGNTIESIGWVYRGDEGGVTLQILPTWCGRYGTANDSNTVWREIKDKTPYSQYGPNYWDKNLDNYVTWSMDNQFMCHKNLGWWKETWNLEPWRQNVPWLDWRMRTPSRLGGWQCNPPKA